VSFFKKITNYKRRKKKIDTYSKKKMSSCIFFYVAILETNLCQAGNKASLSFGSAVESQAIASKNATAFSSPEPEVKIWKYPYDTL
jgi:hypothetical protein